MRSFAGFLFFLHFQVLLEKFGEVLESVDFMSVPEQAFQLVVQTNNATVALVLESVFFEVSPHFLVYGSPGSHALCREPPRNRSRVFHELRELL